MKDSVRRYSDKNSYRDISADNFEKLPKKLLVYLLNFSNSEKNIKFKKFLCFIFEKFLREPMLTPYFKKNNNIL